jgi:hypothetical protein
MNRPAFLQILSGILFLLALCTASCTHDPVGVDAQPKVCFGTEVLPIIQSNCAKSGCHAGGYELDLSTPANILRHVVPFKPNQSSLYTVTTSTWISPMPPSPNSALTLQQRTTIALWILQGASTSCGT